MRQLVLSCFVLVACGNSGGSGTNSFVVRAYVESSNSVDNAAAALQFETYFSVRLDRGAGDPLLGALVQITDSMGSVTLTDDNGNGDYTGSQHGYWGSYTLSVVAGADKVEGATVAGPPLHTLSQPSTNPRPLGGAVDVRWAPTGSMIAGVSTRDWESAVYDDGSFTIPDSIIGRNGGNDDRVRVTRANWTPLAGAIGDSTFTVAVRNGVNFPVN